MIGFGFTSNDSCNLLVTFSKAQHTKGQGEADGLGEKGRYLPPPTELWHIHILNTKKSTEVRLLGPDNDDRKCVKMIFMLTKFKMVRSAQYD